MSFVIYIVSIGDNHNCTGFKTKLQADVYVCVPVAGHMNMRACQLGCNVCVCRGRV